jgi:site-specific DNA recombinase
MSGKSYFSKKHIAQEAIILARVSSKDQEEGYSIDAQANRGKSYCQRSDLSVIRIFEIVESSTAGDRRKFMEIIKFAKAQRKTVAIVADKIDRLQRSFKEYSLLDELIQNGKIELHFVTENYVIHKDSVSHERVMWSVGVLMAQSYVDSLRDNVRRSFDEKIRLGEWVSMAPIGYLNARDAKDRGTIVVDADRALLIRRLFEEFAKGSYTLSQLTDKSKTWGLKSRYGKHLGKSKIHQIINNPFYYGRMIIKENIYDHIYPPLIDKHLFDQCQAVLKRWHKKPYKPRTQEHVLRGLMTCAISGRVITPDVKSRKYANGDTGKWTYLRCSLPDDPKKIMWVREEKVLRQIEAVLNSFRISDNLHQKICAHVKKIEHSERSELRRQLGDLQRGHSIIQTRLDGLMDLLLDRVIDKSEFEKKKEKLRCDQIDIEDRMKILREREDKFKDHLLMLIGVISDAFGIYQSSNIAKKRELLNFMFANLSLKGETLCYSLKKPFDMFIDCSGILQWRSLVDVLRTDKELRFLITTLPAFKIEDDLEGDTGK